MRRRFRSIALLGAALMIAGPLAIAADANTVRTTTRATTYQLSHELKVRYCGPKSIAVDVSSGVTLDTTSYTFYFSNNAKLTHVASTSGDFAAVFTASDDETVTLREAANNKVLPVGGNPWIFLFVPGEATLDDDVLIEVGRCKDLIDQSNGSWRDDRPFPANVIDWLDVSGENCTNHPGPYLEIGAGTDGDGVETKLLFTNNRKKADQWRTNDQVPPPGFHYADADGVIDLEPTGGPIRIRKGGRISTDMWGPGGNPWVWVLNGLHPFERNDLDGVDPDGRCKDL